MDRKPEPEEPETLSEKSADWLLRLQEAPGDLDLAAQAEAWRREHPSHEAAWARTCRAWQAMEALSPRCAPAGTGSQSQTARRDPGLRAGAETIPARQPFLFTRRLAAASALAAAACVLFLIAPVWFLHFQADHYTGTGEIRTVRLDDGSLITLAGASAIQTHMENGRRAVTLLSGEAFFDIAHDANRPFTVTASDLTVTVLGTEFDVRMGRETTSVALLEGAVQAADKTSAADTYRLNPGQALSLAGAGGPPKLLEVDPDQIASWRHGRLIVTDQSVAAVAEQIGRYQNGWISIPDGDLAEKRVTGVYDLSDPARALRTLVAPFGGQSIEITNYLHVLTRLD